MVSSIASTDNFGNRSRSYQSNLLFQWISTIVFLLFYSFQTGKVYTIPDELYITNSPDSSSVSTSSVVRNYTDYIKQQWDWYSFNIGIPGVFSFSMGDAGGEVVKILSDGKKTLFLTKKIYKLYCKYISIDITSIIPYLNVPVLLDLLAMETWPYEFLSGQEKSRFQLMTSKLPTTRNTAEEKKAYR